MNTERICKLIKLANRVFGCVGLVVCLVLLGFILPLVWGWLCER